MAATIAQKIMARAAGVDAVSAGEIVWVTPDLVIAHDHNFPRYREAMRKAGAEHIKNPERLMLTIDHRPYSDDLKIVESRQMMRADVKASGIGHFFDVGRHGISHNVPVDKGIVQPGMMVLTSDTRSPALGCVGAFAVALGGGLVTVLALGKTWLRVPATLKVVVSGSPQNGIMSRDMAGWIAQQISDERADYRVIEFAGPLLAQLDMDQRHTFCNAMVDIGAKGAIVPADRYTADYFAALGHPGLHSVASDPDADFEDVLHFDVSSLEPQVALPPDPTNLVAVSKAAGEPVHQAFVGSCIGGKMEDLRAAANILRGRKIDPRVRLVIIPATQDIFKRAAAEGLMEVFSGANAYIAAGACGPCYGTLAPIAAGETCIGTSTRNEPGRMGSPAGRVLIASAATVAASAVRGVVTDPREFLT